MLVAQFYSYGNYTVAQIFIKRLQNVMYALQKYELWNLIMKYNDEIRLYIVIITTCII